MTVPPLSLRVSYKHTHTHTYKCAHALPLALANVALKPLLLSFSQLLGVMKAKLSLNLSPLNVLSAMRRDSLCVSSCDL